MKLLTPISTLHSAYLPSISALYTASPSTPQPTLLQAELQHFTKKCISMQVTVQCSEWWYNTLQCSAGRCIVRRPVSQWYMAESVQADSSGTHSELLFVFLQPTEKGFRKELHGANIDWCWCPSFVGDKIVGFLWFQICSLGHLLVDGSIKSSKTGKQPPTRAFLIHKALQITLDRIGHLKSSLTDHYFDLGWF